MNQQKFEQNRSKTRFGVYMTEPDFFCYKFVDAVCIKVQAFDQKSEINPILNTIILEPLLLKTTLNCIYKG